MDLMQRNYIERAKNEFVTAGLLKKVTEDKSMKNYLEIEENMTFYSSVISHCYYCIFYSAKALLLKKNIKTSSPGIHKKTYLKFKRNLVDTGILDIQLLKIYRNIIIKADTLLDIFNDERWKRGNFTYNTIPQANKEPAEESLRNAKLFLSNSLKIIDRL